MSNLNSIATVNIQLKTGAALGESFDYVCLVGPHPAHIEDWTESTTYSIGDVVYAGTHVYECTTAGTSGSVAPTGTGDEIEDGTVVWKYVQEFPADVGVYSSLSAIEDAGWVTAGEFADPIGIAARVAFSQNPKPDKIYIAIRKSASGTDEDIALTLARAARTPGWYALCPAGIPESAYSDIAAWVEAQEKLFVYSYVGASDPVTASNYRSVSYYGKVTSAQAESEVPVENKYLGVAAAVKCLSYQSGSETWAFKGLAGVTPSELTDSEIATLEASNVNYFEAVAGLNVTRNGKVKAGEWIDVIRFRDWLTNDMRVRVANVLLLNSKVPYTTAGISLIKSAMIASLSAGQTNGGIMGTEYGDDGTTRYGYIVSVPNAASVPVSERAARILNNCKFEAYLAGAIHLVKITGSLTYIG